jgi:hypothetical protein
METLKIFGIVAAFCIVLALLMIFAGAGSP